MRSLSLYSQNFHTLFRENLSVGLLYPYSHTLMRMSSIKNVFVQLSWVKESPIFNSLTSSSNARVSFPLTQGFFPAFIRYWSILHWFSIEYVPRNWPFHLHWKNNLSLIRYRSCHCFSFCHFIQLKPLWYPLNYQYWWSCLLLIFHWYFINLE